MKSLFLFTSEYPYSNIESFLEEEIIFLCKRFAKVYIVPFHGNGEKRPVPDNCIVLTPLHFGDNRLAYKIKGCFSFYSFPYVVRDFFENRVYGSKKKFHCWGTTTRFFNNCLHNKQLWKYVNLMKEGDVAYFYWGVGPNVISIYLNRKIKKVSRFHGEWDLWEAYNGGFCSLRKQITEHLDKAVFISKKGERYFNERYPLVETSFHPLGSMDYGIVPRKRESDVIKIVSCSSVYPLKRVDLIFKVVNSIENRKIEWTHIGAGKDYENLRELVRLQKSENVTVNLLGRKTHDEVMQYYTSHYFDVFVNLSTNEGVPVSIMEAISFGIPVVATDVGGTSEAVQAESGLLVSVNESIESIANTILNVVDNRTQFSPRTFWESHYNAKQNYTAFAEMLYNL